MMADRAFETRQRSRKGFALGHTMPVDRAQFAMAASRSTPVTRPRVTIGPTGDDDLTDMAAIGPRKHQFERIHRHQGILVKGGAVDQHEIGRHARRQHAAGWRANRQAAIFQRHAKNIAGFEFGIETPAGMERPEQPHLAQGVIILVKGLAINAKGNPHPRRSISATGAMPDRKARLEEALVAMTQPASAIISSSSGRA